MKRKVVECSKERELAAVAPMGEEDDPWNYKPLPIRPNKSTSEQEFSAPPPVKLVARTPTVTKINLH
jgi:hypothetical protein